MAEETETQTPTKKFFKYEDVDGNVCYKQNSFNFDDHITVDVGIELKEIAN